MKIEKKSVSVKGYRKKKHTFTIEKTSMSGYTFITVLKNENPILKCTPLEFVKFKKLFID
jgi:hypothetical protein